MVSLAVPGPEHRPAGGMSSSRHGSAVEATWGSLQRPNVPAQRVNRRSFATPPVV